jgi:hypothetical protein
VVVLFEFVCSTSFHTHASLPGLAGALAFPSIFYSHVIEESGFFTFEIECQPPPARIGVGRSGRLWTEMPIFVLQNSNHGRNQSFGLTGVTTRSGFSNTGHFLQPFDN